MSFKIYKQAIICFGFLLAIGSVLSCKKKEVTPEKKLMISWEVTELGTHDILTDQIPGTDRYQGDLYVLGGAGTMWNSVTDPTWNSWALRKGADMNSLTLQDKPVMAQDFPYVRTEGNEWCWYWLMGLWIDQSTGTFYSIAYCEYNFLNGWVTEAKERRMGLAVSTDKGKTWSYSGDIITQDKSVPPKTDQQYYGAGDLSLLVPGDGYAYVYYKKGFYSLTSLNRVAQDICVARCLLTDKLAPGKWQKFYNNAWNEPGIGGKEQIVVPYANYANVAYNTYLDRYVCIGNAPSGKTFISFCSSLEKQDWTERDFSFPQISHHYNWQVNEDDNNPNSMGQSFLFYITGLNTETNLREGHYFNIKFYKEEQ